MDLKWGKAIKEEEWTYNALQKNKAWTLIPLPKGKGQWSTNGFSPFNVYDSQMDLFIGAIKA